MSEYFERLDTNNYNTEFEYVLYNDLLKYRDWKSLYNKRSITPEQWEQCQRYFNKL